MSEEQFTMSMFASQKELYKAKCEYLESQLSERDKRIEELEKQLHTQVTALRQINSELEFKLDRRSNRVEELEKQVNNLDQALIDLTRNFAPPINSDELGKAIDKHLETIHDVVRRRLKE